MLRVAVRLDPDMLERGELLAEAGALEAAGVDSLWLPELAGEFDGAVLLAGLAGAVRGPRLGLRLTHQAPGWRVRARTLQVLSRGRLVISTDGMVTPPDLPAPLFVEGRAAGEVSGRIHRLGSGLSDLSTAVQAEAGLEHWLAGEGSHGRDAWRELCSTAASAGATGVIVPNHPALLDLLRNPDQEDDRSDLQMATG